MGLFPRGCWVWWSSLPARRGDTPGLERHPELICTHRMRGDDERIDRSRHPVDWTRQSLWRNVKA
ncbi:hypothetical protein [Hyphomonas sp.]|uniref:hypothetical protein n=1 Tax=Hyphomonas sp. TaxID=87 RepID=UPI0025BF7D34|nr:hypothetical protein [Hyphomonas sp.]